MDEKIGKYRNVVLLLTATVNVKGMIYMALDDVTVRENHYIEAISYYFAQTSVKIVLVENTGHNFMAKLSKEIIQSGRVEYLTFEGNNFPKERGKGYGELESISYAMKNSQYIDDYTEIIKVTGRYKVLNINTFIISAKNKSTNACQVMYFKGQPKAFSGIFTVTKDFFDNYLNQNHTLMNDSLGKYFEHILAKTLLDYIEDGHRVSLLPSFPRLSGISGTENIQHRTNKFSFWFTRNMVYKVVKINYLLLDKIIKTLFQG